MYDYISSDGTCYIESEVEDMFNGWLDESGTVDIGGLSYYPSVLLERADPIAHRTMFNDWVDADPDLDEWYANHEWMYDDDDDDDDDA